MITNVSKIKPQKWEVVSLSRRRNQNQKGKMSVSEAGRLGGAKGGPRVRELIEEGKEHENE
jgi:hypothetical protein